MIISHSFSSVATGNLPQVAETAEFNNLSARWFVKQIHLGDVLGNFFRKGQALLEAISQPVILSMFGRNEKPCSSVDKPHISCCPEDALHALTQCGANPAGNFSSTLLRTRTGLCISLG